MNLEQYYEGELFVKFAELLDDEPELLAKQRQEP
jgi:hypothetical protein